MLPTGERVIMSTDLANDLRERNVGSRLPERCRTARQSGDFALTKPQPVGGEFCRFMQVRPVQKLGSGSGVLFIVVQGQWKLQLRWCHVQDLAPLGEKPHSACIGHVR